MCAATSNMYTCFRLLGVFSPALTSLLAPPHRHAAHTHAAATPLALLLVLQAVAYGQGRLQPGCHKHKTLQHYPLPVYRTRTAFTVRLGLMQSSILAIISLYQKQQTERNFTPCRNTVLVAHAFKIPGNVAEDAGRQYHLYGKNDQICIPQPLFCQSTMSQLTVLMTASGAKPMAQLLWHRMADDQMCRVVILSLLPLLNHSTVSTT